MYLSQNKIDYVFHHLQHHISEKSLIADWCQVVKDADEIPSHFENKVIFILSAREIPTSVIVKFQHKEIPILFGSGGEKEPLYEKDEKDNIIFHHDLLSSAFYLLSGQQEIEIEDKDQFGRFPYERSIQKKLECVHLPLVNYYFEMILEAFESIKTDNNFIFNRRRLFKTFGFFLSHDVDRIAFYHPFLVLYKIKQLLGFSPRNYSIATTIQLFFKGVAFNLNPFHGTDPWWNFDWMIQLEKRLGIRSTFFFLKREHRFDNSLYTFSFKKIKYLISKLKREEFEVGLHGTMQSAIDSENMLLQKNELKTVTGSDPVGIRQHYLRFFHPLTFKIQGSAGLKYDTSLAFAEHDGYRNGYCQPFHPFDFDNDRMMQIWEIPLVMMEVSVLNYRKAGFGTMQKAVEHYMAEARKFGGIFSLLWHNCRLCNYEYPGVIDFYEGLLESIVKENPECITGHTIYKKMEELRQ